MIIKRPKVSWLGSIYIGTEAEQLYISLLSILNQKGGIPYEIVLVFDGQVTAEVQTIIINLKKSNDLLNVYKLSENKGLGSALNFGLSKCKGNLIARFDTDDVNHSYRLQSQVKFMDANPQISVLCSSAYEFKSSSKEKFVYCQVRKACYGFLIKYLLSFKNPINHPTVMFRKKDILESKGYPNQKFFEDYLLWLKMRRNKYQFASIMKPLVFVRVDNIYSRRYSYNYLKNEFSFIKNSFVKNKYISFIFFPVFIIRLFTRLIPINSFQILLRKRFNSKKCINPDLIN